ncbi:NAD-dependent epimerase/dehydratase family protein [Ramlibacter tataouinensis]|uniref:CDP-tyvelose-2-epimerase (CDP-paratose 2-epimerase)-like protein n=1 Tax=Ramlibacter tataouinensis (strain ATCC BAA-407 / DSM 14655 / LMG 21543 / TTB310) TaxID=365046 RepID=F5Y5J8_RAMTT|nr:NAD-dependent epimerase/dehydratase family protein [Ramlibacter tataouinensis]AEG92694.1 CDP-tyvelose-2-epimerase (CDP-paratose 2-epimerase)-like protein [Ramlibacter tataouinensis TTB310]
MSEESLALITGGAGFVGSNLAHRLLGAGRRVRILDNLSRPGVEQNLQWLRQAHGAQLDVVVADIRDAQAVQRAMVGVHQVFHFAAQVAVTTSLEDPQEDFAINAQGTLNVLEAARARPLPPAILLTSTNKVYGGLGDVALGLEGQRYLPVDEEVRRRGIGEARPLDFHSPYGCSKGTADQYVVDYARSYGLTTCVFRMSCIYGPRQFGTEDQGWVAHFLLRALRGESITLYGDGKQVRDVLFVDDLVDAFLLAEQNAARLSGRAFNIGGGPGSTISLLDLVDRIERLQGQRPALAFDDWRTGDQRYYVSDTRAFEQATGWRRRVEAEDGIARLYRWLAEREQAGAPRRVAVEAGAH